MFEKSLLMPLADELFADRNRMNDSSIANSHFIRPHMTGIKELLCSTEPGIAS